MEQLGDKIAAKKIARSVNVPVIEDAILSASEIDQVADIAEKIGFRSSSKPRLAVAAVVCG